MVVSEIKKYQYIDSLRGIAVLLVLLAHGGLLGFNIPIIDGRYGVQLFYIASALTLFMSFSQRSVVEKSPTKNFFIRRLFRIAPMYWLVIALSLLVNGTGPTYWLGDRQSISGWNILFNVLFLHGLNPYFITSLVAGGWSVGVEMMFYCVLPFLFRYIKKISDAFLLLLGSLFIGGGISWYLYNHPLISCLYLWHSWLYFGLLTQLPVFSLGIILYYFNVNKKQIIFPVASFLILLALGLMVHKPYLTAFSIVYLLAWGIVAYKPFILVNKITAYFGKVSYSMYLLHFFVLTFIERLGLAKHIQGSLKNPCFSYNF